MERLPRNDRKSYYALGKLCYSLHKADRTKHGTVIKKAVANLFLLSTARLLGNLKKDS